MTQPTETSPAPTFDFDRAENVRSDMRREKVLSPEASRALGYWLDVSQQYDKRLATLAREVAHGQQYRARNLVDRCVPTYTDRNSFVSLASEVDEMRAKMEAARFLCDNLIPVEVMQTFINRVFETA